MVDAKKSMLSNAELTSTKDNPRGDQVTTTTSNSALLLNQYRHLFVPNNGAVLDLACGQGQNGLSLKQHNISVLFADLNEDHLTTLVSRHNVNNADCWQADFESDDSLAPSKLSNMQLQGAIVFRYLHRPLFKQLKQAIKPGGIIIYETFTEANRQFGRPNRDAFLLKADELKDIFHGWEVIFYFEGIKSEPDRAIAQIVARKPLN